MRPASYDPAVECVVYGVGSLFVDEGLEVLRRLGWTVSGGIENVETDYRPPGLEPIVGVDEIPPEWLSLPAVISLVTPGHRQQAERDATAHGFRSFATLVDPTAVVARATTIAEGTIVFGGALVSPQTEMGRFACVCGNVVLGHHSTVEDYATLGPSSTLCGKVRVGRGAFVGAGAVLNPGVSVGANALVAAGAVVRSDVEPHTIVAGNPATVVQTGIAGFGRVSVDAG
jgi:sugar O-acyltransferase (sialic acid O-acetyltransferase NeuD family)